MILTVVSDLGAVPNGLKIRLGEETRGTRDQRKNRDC